MKYSQALTKEARGRPCMIRLPDICCGDEATTVLAHFRLTGISGMGLKPPSFLGAWACFRCHSAVDKDKSPATQLAFAHGVFRTQYALMREGKL